MMNRRVAAVFVALAMATTVLATPTTALAQQDNTAIAINKKDGNYMFDLSIAIVRTLSGNVDVDNGNAAAAVSSCSDCRTVAAAIQVVLIMSDPDVVMPTNIAIAINDQCESCETFATAFQLVVTTGGMVRISAEGHKAIADLRNELKDLLKDGEDVPLGELHASISALVIELFEVVIAELEPVGPKDAGESDDQATATPTATPSPTDASPSPSPSESADGTPNPEASPSPSASESPTPEPESSSSPAP